MAWTVMSIVRLRLRLSSCQVFGPCDLKSSGPWSDENHASMSVVGNRRGAIKFGSVATLHACPKTFQFRAPIVRVQLSICVNF